MITLEAAFPSQVLIDSFRTRRRPWALRWRAPKPAGRCEGTRAADQLNPVCTQGGHPGDCLYLNVDSIS